MRKLTIYMLTVILALVSSAGAQENAPSQHPVLYEKSIQTEFLFGQLVNEDDPLHMEPIFFTYGFKINSWLNLENHKGTVQFILAPFLAPITSPKSAIALGLNVAFRYSYPLSEKFHIFAELGFAPMYFGLNTDEQEKAGFNFLDQGGVGFQYFFTKDKAVGIGYRRAHISHLGFSDSDNSGIDADAVFLSFSKFF